MDVGDRVRVSNLDPEGWSQSAISVFTGQLGIVLEVKEDPFTKEETLLIVFDVPVRRWVMLSNNEPATNSSNFITMFHFHLSDLEPLQCD
jgi:hypothetical protein